MPIFLHLWLCKEVIIIIFIIIKICWQHGFYWLSLGKCPYWPLLMISPLDGIQCLHRADKYRFLLVEQHWCVHVLESIRECLLWVYPYFSSSASHVLFRCFASWEVSSHIAKVLLDSASGICSKWHAASLCNSYQVFKVLNSETIQ